MAVFVRFLSQYVFWFLTFWRGFLGRGERFFGIGFCDSDESGVRVAKIYMSSLVFRDSKK